MKLADFDFELPESQIARVPAARREDARLLAYDRTSAKRQHCKVTDLPDFLRAGDLVVLNDTRVIPARLGMRRATGGAVEGLVVQFAGNEIELMADGGGRLHPGDRLNLEGIDGAFIVLLEKRGERWSARVEGASDGWLEAAGRVPLPPYIRKARKRAGEGDELYHSLDRERYQTVFAREGAAVAAPTAGLHFTNAILSQLLQKGVDTARVRLDVGPGTFASIRVDDLDQHRIAAENYHIPAESAEKLNLTKKRGGRIVAIGTTVVRTLEFAGRSGEVAAGSGATDMFIKPGFQFKIVDALMTNFHIPQSTLLMLVCAFAGRETVLDLYREAVRENYRFYSYGDATLFI